MLNHPFEGEEVIFSYPLLQGIEDGIYAELFKNRWGVLSGGKPIIATTALFEAVSRAALREIWNEYVVWRKEVMPTLPSEEQLFTTKMNDKEIWLLEDEQMFLLLYPEDY